MEIIYTFMNKKIVEQLIEKGVHIPNPESVYISDDVKPDRISNDNVTIFSGCKLIGEQTLIMKDCKIGYEGPVTLENVWVGENTDLKGGYFKSCVFTGSNQVGSGAHFREGTILEEQANAAHTVGLKQTILLPFVTLGSLINFCDCYMAGGTSRKDHSEVGSSFIHFNYTPNQDKATASMIGDVSNGVMLSSAPIFLGGQGGLVGPVRIGYGCVSAAGSILRKNEERQDRLLLGGAFREMSIKKDFAVYKNISHIFNNNIRYIAGLISLKAWYMNVRPLFAQDRFSSWLVSGMQVTLETCIQERIKRFKVFCDKLVESKNMLLSETIDKESVAVAVHNKAIEKGRESIDVFNEASSKSDKLNSTGQKFVSMLKSRSELRWLDYIKTIQSLDEKEREAGTEWLTQMEQKIIDKLKI